MVSSEEVISFLSGRTKFGIKLGLEKISSLSDFLGNPQNDFPVIHVGGTNGKGSTSSFIASIFRETGLRVGLYTSPHLVFLNERIKINGIPISNLEFCEILEQIIPKSVELENTFFDVVTAAAFKYFSKQKVDLAVIEVGMGGRFDSTNIISPVASVITSIGFDHQKYLGNTLREIAFEKAGIIKKKIPVFISDLLPEAKEVIQETADKKQSVINEIISTEKSYLKKNAELAVSVSKFVSTQLNISLSSENINSGIRNMKDNTGLMGRFDEIEWNDSLFILDAAHNSDGIIALAELYKSKYGDIEPTVLFGCVADKDSQIMLKNLRNLSNSIILTLPKLNRNNSLKNLSNEAKNAGFSTMGFLNSIEAFDFAISKNNNNPIIICGSLYLLGEIYEEMFRRKIVNNNFEGLTINQ